MGQKILFLFTFGNRIFHSLGSENKIGWFSGKLSKDQICHVVVHETREGRRGYRATGNTV